MQGIEERDCRLIKPAFAAGLALAGLIAAERLSRPSARPGLVRAALANAAPAQGAELIFGDTWKRCPFSIAIPRPAGALLGSRVLRW